MSPIQSKTDPRFSMAARLRTAFLGLGLLATATGAGAATITVNNASDYNSGSGPSNDDGLGCTLRKAIANANNNAQTYTACPAGSGDENTIAFNGVSSIKLGSYGSPFYINRSLSFQGPVIIDGDNQGDIFRIATSGVTLTLDGTTLKKGSNSAVLIFSANSSLVATGCSFVDNTNPGPGGGAISSSSPIHITACSFMGNSANGSGDGGGAIRLSASDPSTITLSSFINNSAKTSGGAISFNNSGNLAALAISLSEFTNNSAEAEGGATEGGGAIWHQQGFLSIVESIFVNNVVEGDEGRGGAVFMAVGAPAALIERNLFTLNEVEGAMGLGGAIFSARTAIANGNSFISNKAENDGRGGAIASTAKLKGGFDLEFPGFMLSNSTLHDNSASYGGAIYNMGPEQGSVDRGITLVNVTIEGNRALQTDGGGGIYAAEIQTGETPETDMRNTILANNTANGSADNCASNVGIPIQNHSGNLLWPANSCDASPAFSGAAVGDPKLASPLPDVPPPVVVMKPQGGSAAVQRGNPDTCADFPILNLDQRLFLRPNPGNTPCDAGAYESEIGPPAPQLDITPNAGLAFGQVPINTSAQLQATVTNPGSLPLSGLQLSVSGARFSLQSTTCGAALAQGESCTAMLQFTPLAAPGELGEFSAIADGGLEDEILLSGSGFVAQPGLNLQPDLGLSFASQAVGSTSAFQNASVQNSGNVTLTALSFAVSPPFQLAAGGTCTTSLGAGANCTQRVVFAPTAAGAANASMVASSAQGSSDAIQLTGFGSVAASLVLSPAGPIALGRVPVGTPSDLIELVLHNPGTETASNVAFAFLGGSSPTFSLEDENCPTNLPGGQSCQVNLRYFSPTFGGPMSAQFRAQANFLFGNTVQLSATGYGPARIEIVPDGVDFGDVQTGTTSPTRALSMRNTGGESYTLFELSLGAPFEIDSSCSLPAIIIPGQACAVAVDVSPLQDGDLRTMFIARATAAGPGNGDLVEISDQVPLMANGFTPADLQLTPLGPLDFGPVAIGQSSAAQRITLLNPGSLPLTSLSASTAAPFQIVANNCSSTLAGGASCEVDMVLTPAGAGAAAGTFSAIATSTVPILQSAALQGSGFALAPNLRLQPPDGLDFGSIQVGQQSAIQSATLSNIGNASASISLVSSVAMGFTLSGGTCGANLAAGQSCRIDVRFAPGSAGSPTGSLAVNSAGMSVQIALRGSGIDPAVPAFVSTPGSPGPLQFFARPREMDVRTIIIGNPGTGTLEVGQPVLSGSHAGEFVLLTPLPLQVPAGAATQMLSIGCTPTGAGPRTALLTLQTNDPAKPSVGFALNCEGLVPTFHDGFERDPADV